MNKKLRELQQTTIESCIKTASEIIPQSLVDEELQNDLAYIMGWEIKINHLIDEEKTIEQQTKDLDDALELLGYILDYTDDFCDEDVEEVYAKAFSKVVFNAYQSIMEMTYILEDDDEEACETYQDKLETKIAESGIDLEEVED